MLGTMQEPVWIHRSVDHRRRHSQTAQFWTFSYQQVAIFAPTRGAPPDVVLRNLGSDGSGDASL